MFALPGLGLPLQRNLASLCVNLETFCGQKEMSALTMKVQTHYYAVDGMISILSSVLYLVFAAVLLVPLLESTSMSESHHIISSYILDGSMALFCWLHKQSIRSIKDFFYYYYLTF